nr:hypothetical protein [Lysinibacillus boronitolerans]
MNKYFKMCAPVLLALSLAACGTDKAEESTSTANTAETSATESQTEQAKSTQTITYLASNMSYQPK